MTVSPVERILEYQFAKPALLKTALTHRSFASSNNERLEFLGDGILDCVIAAILYQRFPDLPEGDLSRFRASLVRQDCLHGLAIRLKLGEHLRLGEGELKSGGAERPSILADCLEAIFGAVYLDAGFDAAFGLINRLYEPLLKDLKAGQLEKDAKTRLQEWLQARKRPLPKYSVQQETGAAHERAFEVRCELADPRLQTLGRGSTRRIAEQEAAREALKELKA